MDCLLVTQELIFLNKYFSYFLEQNILIHNQCKSKT